MVPRYKHYEQDIYRELRKNAEFNQLYLDIESYKKENKMPNFKKFKKATAALAELDKKENVIASMNEAIDKSKVMVSSLGCGS
jgi:hypothetical protein